MSRYGNTAVWRTVRSDMIHDMRPLPGGAPTPPAPSVNSPTGDDDEDYSDMPPLEANPDYVGTHSDYDGDWPAAWLDQIPSGMGPTIHTLPMDEDLDWAWGHFVDSERTDDDLARILAVLYRLLAQNNHLIREATQAQTQVEALRASLGWTQQELAIALFRETEGLTTATGAPGRLGMAAQQRSRVRTRIMTEERPLELGDEDEVDEPRRDLQLHEANDLLLRVVDGRGVPTDVGLDPPAYDRVVRLFAMNVTEGTGGLVTRARAGRRPLLSAGEQECIVILLNVNGLGALTLLDAGSTTELLSNDFARVAQCDIIKLDNPATLQLGCAGSRSRINFGTRSPVTVGRFGADVYFDIANLDHYNAVLGTPFLRRFGVMLDFKNNCVHIDGQSYPALSRAQVNDVLNKRSARNHGRERPSTARVSPAPIPEPPQ